MTDQLENQQPDTRRLPSRFPYGKTVAAFLYFAALFKVFAPHPHILLFTEEFCLALAVSVLFFMTQLLLAVGERKYPTGDACTNAQLVLPALLASAVMAALLFELLITTQDIIEHVLHLHLVISTIALLSWLGWLGWDIFFSRYYSNKGQARIISGMTATVNAASLLVALSAIHASAALTFDPWVKILMEVALCVSLLVLAAALLFSILLLLPQKVAHPVGKSDLPARYGLLVGCVAVLGGGLLLSVACPYLTLWTGGTSWRQAAPGLYQRTVTGYTITGPVRVTAVRAETASWQLHVIDAHHGQQGAGGSALRLCPPTGAIINANFFNENNLDPIGLVIARGKTVSPLRREHGWFGKWGIFYVSPAGAEIIPAEQPLPAGVTEAIQAGPLLVTQGILTTNPLRQYAPRAAIGLDADGHIIFAVAEGYVSFVQWASCLRDRLGCRSALNLDGGPSAQLAFHGATSYYTPDTVTVPLFLQLIPGNLQ